MGSPLSISPDCNRGVGGAEVSSGGLTGEGLLPAHAGCCRTGFCETEGFKAAGSLRPIGESPLQAAKMTVIGMKISSLLLQCIG